MRGREPLKAPGTASDKRITILPKDAGIVNFNIQSLLGGKKAGIESFLN